MAVMQIRVMWMFVAQWFVAMQMRVRFRGYTIMFVAMMVIMHMGVIMQ